MIKIPPFIIPPCYSMPGVMPGSSFTGGKPIKDILHSALAASTGPDFLNVTWAGAGDRKTWMVSIWMKPVVTGVEQLIFMSGTGATNKSTFSITSTGKFEYKDTISSTLETHYTTVSAFTNTTDFMNVVIQYDSTVPSLKIFVDGPEAGLTETVALDASRDSFWNSTTASYIAYNSPEALNALDGYITEFVSLPGLVLEGLDFGKFNVDGKFIPIDAEIYEMNTNGFHLDFEDDTAMGNDIRGTNNWTGNNGWSGTSTQQIADTPTQNSGILNPKEPASDFGAVFSEGNRRVTSAAVTVSRMACSNSFDAADHTYCEMKLTATSGGNKESAGIVNGQLDSTDNALGFRSHEYAIRIDDGNKYNDDTETAYGNQVLAGDIIGIRVDAGSLYFYINGTIQNGGTAAFTGITGTCIWSCSIEDAGTNPDMTMRFNEDEFTQTVPTGAVSVRSDNAPIPPIGDVTAGFQAKVYVGNGISFASGGQSIVFDGTSLLSPDLTIIKNRDFNGGFDVFTTVRGVEKYTALDTNAVEVTSDETLTSFDVNGFTCGNNNEVNNLNEKYASYNWRAGGTPTAENIETSGAMTSGSVSLNNVLQTSYTPPGSPSLYPRKMSISQTFGISIILYNGTSATATLPHGLGEMPEIMMTKSLTDDVGNWFFNHIDGTLHGDYTPSGDDPEKGNFSITASGAESILTSYWNDTKPDTNLITLGDHADMNETGDENLMLAFVSRAGFSKMGSYIGDTGGDEIYVQTGFRPRFLFIRQTGISMWRMFDTARNNQGNPVSNLFRVDQGIPEVVDSDLLLSFESNGFIVRNGSPLNGNTGVYFYMCYA